MYRPLLPVLLALNLLLAQSLHAEESSDDDKAADTQTPAVQPIPRAPLAERSRNNAEALERQVPRDEQRLLQAGDETFLALWKPANAPQSKGLIILLPSANESADWPQAIKPLRLKLPDADWSTLSLNLPDPIDAPLPAAILPRPPEPKAKPADADADASKETATTEPEQSASATDTPAPVIDPATRIFARIQAALEFAEQQDASNIVLLGHGSGAYWAALYLKERKPEPVKHLVTVAAQLPAGQTPALDELIPGLKLATGDFFYKDLPVERATALRRKQASKRLGHDSYTQIALETLPGNQPDEQEQLYRRVRGWLDKQ